MRSYIIIYYLSFIIFIHNKSHQFRFHQWHSLAICSIYLFLFNFAEGRLINKKQYQLSSIQRKIGKLLQIKQRKDICRVAQMALLRLHPFHPFSFKFCYFFFTIYLHALNVIKNIQGLHFAFLNKIDEILQYIFLFIFMKGGEKRYAPKVEKPSKVLLVCVYDTIVFQISNEIIRSKFDEFGLITKLLIFQKGQVTKFFIEYESVGEATNAKNALDNTKLCDSICKMTIYFSNFSNVDLKQPVQQNIVYPGYQISRNEKSYQFNYDNNTKSTMKEIGPSLEHCDDEFIFDSFSPFNTFQRSKTDNPRTLQDQINRLNEHKYPASINQQIQIERSIEQSIDSLLGPNFGGVSPQEQKKQSTVGLKMKTLNDSRSSVLYFPLREHLRHSEIYNIFSNFGNISCIIIKKESIYIKFRTKQFAAIAVTYLNNYILGGNILALREYPQSSPAWQPMEGEYCECVYYDQNFDRFTPHRSITINPPSQTLHVSSMKREICKENCLRDIFSQYGYVERVHILQQSNEKNMALIRFRSVEDSFNAISNLHNQTFSGRKMQISFTKSKV